MAASHKPCMMTPASPAPPTIFFLGLVQAQLLRETQMGINKKKNVGFIRAGIRRQRHILGQAFKAIPKIVILRAFQRNRFQETYALTWGREGGWD